MKITDEQELTRDLFLSLGFVYLVPDLMKIPILTYIFFTYSPVKNIMTKPNITDYISKALSKLNIK